ncbi:hypothetical protein [Fibrella forsythiae]|uniref:Uncharacterized protein n=1 Tax=Fibrella forsythiae TaxID=2817061 RepID=A0ABS3JTD5_9BACT|nr:hypothetical protein [Fibrella forsythiae]MBO0953213.1 hypothetical protein [Fibrella forsythiae]
MSRLLRWMTDRTLLRFRVTLVVNVLSIAAVLSLRQLLKANWQHPLPSLLYLHEVSLANWLASHLAEMASFLIDLIWRRFAT